MLEPPLLLVHKSLPPRALLPSVIMVPLTALFQLNHVPKSNSLLRVTPPPQSQTHASTSTTAVPLEELLDKTSLPHVGLEPMPQLLEMLLLTSKLLKESFFQQPKPLPVLLMITSRFSLLTSSKLDGGFLDLIANGLKLIRLSTMHAQPTQLVPQVNAVPDGQIPTAESALIRLSVESHNLLVHSHSHQLALLILMHHHNLLLVILLERQRLKLPVN